MAEAIGGSTGNGLPANPLLGTDDSTAGVTGQSNTGPGVWGQSIGLVPPTPPGGVQRSGPDTQPGTDGVLGEGNNGVRGVSAAGNPKPTGLDFGLTPAPLGAGVWGTNSAGGPGVYGASKSGDGVRGDGVNGVWGQSSDASGSGVSGQNTSTGAGVTGITLGGTGVSGQSGTGAGVSGTSITGTAIDGTCKDPKGLAGKFTGNVEIDGDITAVNTVTVQKDLKISGDITSVNTITVAKDVVLTGADCAEQFDAYDVIGPEPGTIVVIDDEGKLRESRGAYDKRVAGVVSGAGEFRPAIVLDRRGSSENRISVALVGKVYCKVDADPAPIAVGDLLTTSSRPGFGMKASDATQAFGAVIGKALRPLREGQALIPILVALQ
jgi:hypothetical protein